MAAVERRAADQAGATAGQACVFEALTPSGQVRLAFEGAAAPRCAAEAALQLVRAEPLLAHLDGWLAGAGDGLDWRWSPRTDAGADAWASGVATARWLAEGSCDTPVCLGLPWALLRQRGEPPAAPAAVLAWAPAAAVCVLAEVSLTLEELAALEPGGALLLRASFEPHWIGRLRADHEPRGQGLAIEWVDPERPQPCRGSADAASGRTPAAWAAAGLEVRRAVTAPMAPAVLAGWASAGWALAGAGPQLPALQPEVGLWLCQRGVETCLAQGRLVPWGRGRAMLIDGLRPAAGATEPVAPNAAADAPWT
jgi:hypothetical protein